MTDILIVHPQVKTREAAASKLKAEGHRVLQAGDGAAALEVYRKDRPGLVLLNEYLPGMPSYQVFSEIKRTVPEAKVLVLTVCDYDEMVRNKAKFGIRPFLPDEVLLIVEALPLSKGLLTAQGAGFTPRVLVIDDDAGVQATIKRFLGEKGYEVVTTSSSVEGLALLRRVRPHLVLLDINMPELDGVAALSRIRDLDRHVAVMMITGQDAAELMAKCRDLGAYDYLLKPLELDYLEFSVYSKIVLMTL